MLLMPTVKLTTISKLLRNHKEAIGCSLSFTNTKVVMQKGALYTVNLTFSILHKDFSPLHFLFVVISV